MSLDESTGIPASLLMPTDYITLRLPLVDEVGFDAAVLLERVRWRCELRPEGWVATYADLVDETRLSLRRVKAAVTVLRDRGWLTSENAGQGSRTLRWSVVLDAGTPKGPERTDGGISTKRTDHRSETDFCTSIREDTRRHSAAHSADAEPALIPAPEPQPEAPSARHLVAAWIDAYTATKGHPPDKVITRPLAGTAGRVAKTRTDRASWVAAWEAFQAAGRRGDLNVNADLLKSERATRSNGHFDSMRRRAAAASTPSLPGTATLLGMLQPATKELP